MSPATSRFLSLWSPTRIMTRSSTKGTSTSQRTATKSRRTRHPPDANDSLKCACPKSARSEPVFPPAVLWRQELPHSLCIRLSGSSFLALSPTPGAPSPWLAVAAFIGLPLALWTYKCLMMVLFQRKIIYMGYIPPGARTQSLDQNVISAPASGILCDEIRISGEGNIQLHGLIVRRQDPSLDLAASPKTVFLYLQGNAGNPLGRLPLFERLILGTSTRQAQRSNSGVPSSPLNSSVVIAVAPRSYWKSTNKRPTERGIISDYFHALSYVTRNYPVSNIVLYGHSLGGAVALCLAARIKSDDFQNVRGIILENPFASIPGMVQALYPQRWLPYHYLGRFAFDKWDAVSAIRDAQPGSLLERLRQDMMIILSKKDEVVPNEMGKRLFAEAGGVNTCAENLRKLIVLPHSLHDTAWTDRQWRKEIEAYTAAIEKRSA